jgi:hypothetical protein
MGANPRDEAAKLDAFRGALEKLGYIDGQTIRIELRYAMGQPDRFGSLARELESVVPWSALCAVIEPFYPKPGNGSPPVGVERMLRIYFLQQWFNLSDPAVEEALYDSQAMRRFVGIDLGRPSRPETLLAASSWRSVQNPLSPASAASSPTLPHRSTPPSIIL